MDDQFQLLVSPDDYKKLMDRGQQLEALYEKQSEINKRLTNQVIDLKQQNQTFKNQLQQAKFNFLQAQTTSQGLLLQRNKLNAGLMEAKQIIQSKEQTIKNMKQKNSEQEQTIVKLKLLQQKFQLSEINLKSYMQQLQLQIRLKLKAQKQVEDQRNQLELHSNQIKTLKETLKSQTCQIQQKQRVSVESNKVINSLKEQISSKNFKIKQLTNRYESQLTRIRQESQKNSRQTQSSLKQQFQQLMTHQSQQMSDKISIITMLKQQTTKLKEMLKAKENEIQNIKVVFEKRVLAEKQKVSTLSQQYESIIQIMEQEKKKIIQSQKKSKLEKDQLKEVKNLLEEYFMNLAVNLYNLGNLETCDIRGIMNQQQQIVKKYVNDTVSNLILSMAEEKSKCRRMVN